MRVLPINGFGLFSTSLALVCLGCRSADDPGDRRWPGTEGTTMRCVYLSVFYYGLIKRIGQVPENGSTVYFFTETDWRLYFFSDQAKQIGETPAD